jgi:hypothetical protein
MSRQLNIRSDEAHAVATDLAQRLGTTTTRVVVEALRRYRDNILPAQDILDRPMTPEQKERFDRILALAREARRTLPPGATSDHSDMYDENGLPI